MLDPNRPESWNATMVLSGEPLITDEQFEKLLANAPASLEEMEHHDPVRSLRFSCRTSVGFWVGFIRTTEIALLLL
jgi:hypothetical protein